jgi:hypothetical protein
MASSNAEPFVNCRVLPCSIEECDSRHTSAHSSDLTEKSANASFVDYQYGQLFNSCRTFASVDGIHQTLRLIWTKQCSSRGICMVRRA